VCRNNSLNENLVQSIDLKLDRRFTFQQDNNTRTLDKCKIMPNK